jgi:prolyl-tRNA synthetase
VYEDILAVPVVKGRKSDKEKFAGADYTTTVEGFIPGVGRGIQGATSHCLGKNFAKIFDITFESEKKTKEYVVQNSWGLTTRSIGVAVMVHSDDKGLVLPPRVSPLQVVIVPIVKKDIQPEFVGKPSHALVDQLKALGVRARVDDRPEYNPGWKYNHWELKGVPLRIEIGPQDVEKQTCVVVRRDTGVKTTFPLGEVAAKIPALLETIQGDMLNTARAKRDESIVKVYKWEDFVPVLNQRKLCLTPWCNSKASELLVKERSSDESKADESSALSGAAKTLCIPFDQPDLPAGTKCFITGEPATCWVLWGRSY